MTAIAMEQSIYQKYGGFPAIRSVIFSFYEEALDSDIIGDFFADIDISRLIEHQTKFVSFLLGGPVDYAEQRLRQAHAHLGIRDHHFDEMKRILRGTLADAGFHPDDSDTVLGAIEARRATIVT